MKKKLFSFLLIMFTFYSFAQNDFFDNYVYQSWTSFGELSGTTSTDIYQTLDGYINIGTYEGLVQFDGVKFDTINKSSTPGVNFISVRVIYEDSRGNKWIGTNDEGLHKISHDGNKIYTTDNGLPNNSIRALVEDQKGNLWVGTAGGVAYITFDGKIITPQFQAGTIANGIIASSLYCDTTGKIWLTTSNERGLFLYVDGLFKQRPELEPFGMYFATSIFQDRLGTYWIGLGENGIITIRNGVVNQIKTGTLLDHSSTCTIFQENDGTMWFGTEKGLVVYNSGKFIEYNGTHKEEFININKIIRDREGNIWLATDRNGVGKMSHGKFRMEHLDTTVNAIAEDTRGLIWVGTDKGVLCYENDVRVENKLTQYTKDLRIRHVEASSDGGLLVSCYTKPGQLYYNRNTIKSWTTDDSLAGNKVRVAIETIPHEYYVGTTTGLSIIHADGSIKTFKQLDGLETEYVMCIYKDNDGIVWVGTDGGGIYLFKNEEIYSKITSADGLAGNVIFKISQDKEGAYWICTGNGITRCTGLDTFTKKPSSYKTINSENGIGTNSVFQVIFDKQDNIWLTSNHGIASVSASDLLNTFIKDQKTASAEYYSKNDGLDSDGPTSTSLSIMDRHGRLWFTMVDGIAIYDPQKIHKTSITPLVLIESVKIDDVEYKDIDSTIMLEPGTKRINIKYTGISFDAPERITFSHKLTDFDDDFSALSSERTVSYTNLTPGKHSFLVNATNGSGIKSEDNEIIFLYQTPYIYQRPAFWIVIASLFVGILLGIAYNRERRIRIENLRLETLVQARTVDLEIEKDKSDSLLHAILPKKIADRMKETGKKSFGENFECASILFSDIVGFTNISSGYSAEEIVDALNSLFSLFDERASSMGVEKIKTIGDAYMAACGIPEANENHAKTLLEFAKGMYEDLENYNKNAKIKFQIRIGLNCGPVTAGIIGTTKFIYDVWGNTVNVANRMESVCNPGQIRVSENFKNLIKQSDTKFSDVIECEIKGKGLMKTYEIV